MDTPRTYGESCGLAHALDLVGERWALLVVRELLLGPKRFTDLRHGLLHASPNLVSQRLRELERVGVVRKRRLPPPAATTVYELTEWGRELEPIVITLGNWGMRSPLLDDEAPVGVDSAMLAVRTFFTPASSWTAVYDLRVDGTEWAVRVDGPRIEVIPGAPDPDHADATVTTDAKSLTNVLGDRTALLAAIRRGDVTVAGDRRLVERLIGSMVFPSKVEVLAG